MFVPSGIPFGTIARGFTLWCQASALLTGKQLLAYHLMRG
jgi:hypothetical protein